MKRTPVKERLAALGLIDLWSDVPLARLRELTGCREDELSHVLHGRRCTPRVQEAIAVAAGMTVADLFGDWAWFKAGARWLRRRLKEQQAAQVDAPTPAETELEGASR